MNGLLTTKQVAEMLRVNVETIYRLLRQNRLKGFKIMHDWRIKESELQAFINGRRGTESEHTEASDS